MSTQYIRWPGSGSGSGITTYPTFGDFPASATDGAAAIALDTDTLYIFNSGSMTWKAVASPGGTGISIGESVLGGTDGSVLFIDGLGKLSQSTDFTFNGTDLNIANAIQLLPYGGATPRFEFFGTSDGGYFGFNLNGTHYWDIGCSDTGNFQYYNNFLGGPALDIDSATNDATFNGNVTSPFFYGDGSNLTGIIASIAGYSPLTSASQQFEDDGAGGYQFFNGSQVVSYVDSNGDFFASNTFLVGPTALENNNTYPSGSFIEGQHIAADIPVGGMNVLAMSSRDSNGTNATPPFGTVFGMFGAVDTGGPIVPYLVTTQFGVGGLGLAIQADYLGGPIGYTMFGAHNDNGSGAIVQVNGQATFGSDAGVKIGQIASSPDINGIVINANASGSQADVLLNKSDGSPGFSFGYYEGGDQFFLSDNVGVQFWNVNRTTGNMNFGTGVATFGGSVGATGVWSIDPSVGDFNSASGVVNVAGATFTTGILDTAGSFLSIDTEQRHLVGSNGSTVALDWSSGIMVGDGSGLTGVIAAPPTLTNSHIFVGNASNAAVDVAMSGDVTINNTGVTAIGASKVTNTMLAGSIDLTTKVTGLLPIANGGTNSSATATAGGVGYGTGTAHAYMSAGSAGQIVRSGGAGAPTWSSATYPSTPGSNGRLLVSDSTNWVSNSMDLANSNAVGSSVLSITNGGTGQNNTSNAFNALAPSQTGNNGKYLTTNATTTSWATIAAGDIGSGTLSASLFPAFTGDVTTSAGAVATSLVATSNGTLATLSKSTGVAVHGTNTNDSAASGYVGEYVEAISAQQNFPTSGQYGDLASISLTAGDWEVTAIGYATRNGATVTQWEVGISTTSGNSSSGMTYGTNLSNGAGPTSSADANIAVPCYRLSLSGTTTVYFKYFGGYSVAIPRAQGRISARRMR